VLAELSGEHRATSQATFSGAGEAGRAGGAALGTGVQPDLRIGPGMNFSLRWWKRGFRSREMPPGKSRDSCCIRAGGIYRRRG